MSSPSDTSGISGYGEGSVGDHLAITNLLYRYAAGIDNLDREVFADCFTDDAILWGENGEVATFKLTGRAEIAQIVDWHRDYAFTMHNVHNHSYTVDGDTAQGQTYCIATTVQGEPDAWTTRDQYIFYYDQLAKQGDRWRLSARRFVLFYMHEVPIENFPIGPRDHRGV